MSIRAPILDPITGELTGERVSVPEDREALIERALRDDRFLTVVRNLDKAKDRLGPQAFLSPVMTWQPIVITDQTAVVGTTETLLWTALFTQLPAQFFSMPGQAVRLTAAGKITAAASTPGNWTLTMRWGTTTAGTSLGATAALALQTSQTNITWRFSAEVVARAVGSGTAGSLIPIGTIQGGTTTTLFTTGPVAALPASAPAGVGIDTTITAAVLLTSTLGSASDSQTAQIVILEALN